MDSSFFSTLAKRGNVAFPANVPFVEDLHAAGGRVARQPSGHLAFYGPHGRRFLATDPDGNPLHECEWVAQPQGPARLARARIRLDWGQWVGLKPQGLTNSTRLDLSRKPGWERLRADDLRRMAAQALHVPFEEIRFFYGDDDLVIDAQGQATIRHKKDAFYVLEEETFAAAPERVRFMACMGAMHWDRIDFLPVVELFQSLLPGTGSATLELIRGLYDDQNEGHSQPLALRYRGIPTYPSEAAFRLFSAFFTPQARTGGNPFPIFMDQPRSHEVTWLPAADPPRRYFDSARNLCVTVTGGVVQKITLSDDSTGLPYVNAGRAGLAPCDRSLRVTKGLAVLRDGEQHREFPINPAWGTIDDTVEESPRQGLREQGEGERRGWRAFFNGPPPLVPPVQAFSTVLLYPADDTEIGEPETQPFVADYLQDALEEQPELAARLAATQRALIDNFDAAVTSCIRLDRPRDYRVRYYRPAFAQKQAQTLWNQLAQARKLEWAKQMTFVSAEAEQAQASGQIYDVIYAWLPFSQFHNAQALHETAGALAEALRPGGLAFLVGPAAMSPALQTYRLRILRMDPVASLPSFRMHQSILPQARVKPDLMLFQTLKY